MNSILASIISTIAFYDAVGKTPLTKVELYKHLISKEGFISISFGDFVELLDREWEALKPKISQYRGFYYLLVNKDAYAKRIHIGKTCIKKWRIARRIIRLISFLPYVKMVAVTGSLAMNATHKESDIDVLIVAKYGHIWTTRMFVSFLTHILGKRRHGPRIRDRICLNHFMADSHLLLRPRSLFSAHIFGTMVRVWGKDEVQKAFDSQNLPWARSYFPNLLGHGVNRRAEAHKFWPLCALCSLGELGLAKLFGGVFEGALRTVQAKKIRQRPEGAQGAIFDDEALVFHHPRPRNQEAMVLYEQHIKALEL